MLKKRFMLFCVCFFCFASAQAKGPGVINTGDEIFKVGTFPQELINQYEDLNDFNVGYKCSHIGIFWADVKIWDCSLVGITDAEPNTYYELPKDVTAYLKQDPNYQENKMQRTPWNQYGIFVLIFALIISIIIGRKAKKSE